MGRVTGGAWRTRAEPHVAARDLLQIPGKVLPSHVRAAHRVPDAVLAKGRFRSRSSDAEHRCLIHEWRRSLLQLEIDVGLMELAHGAEVFDVYGQNFCLSNCLKRTTEDVSKMRNLIFFPDGHIRYRWDLPGAIIL